MKRIILIGPMFQSKAELLACLKRAGVSRSSFGDCSFIGVDGGVMWAKRAGLALSCAVGDWDSLKTPQDLQGLTVQTLSREKDRSDLYFALKEAAKRHATEVVATGFSGGRLDHYLGSIAECAEWGRRLCVQMVNPESSVWFLSSRFPKWCGRLKKGQVISIFSLNGDARGVRLRGFKYKKKLEALSFSTQGLSNVATRLGTCSIEIDSGALMVVIPLTNLGRSIE